MGNQQRDDEAGAFHHVMNRGARRHQTFESRQDCTHFLYLLGQAWREYGLETHAYCLMGNHYHLLVRSAEGALSEAMAMVGSVYTRRFNRRHGYDGPLFKACFLSKRVDTDEYLLQASRYIHRNPIDLGATVDKATYDWSSYCHYLSDRPVPRFLTTSVVLGLANGPGPYRDFVERRHPTDAALHWSASVLPDPSTERSLIVPGAADVVVPLEEIATAVALEFGTSAADLAKSRRRGQRRPKLAALLISLRLSGIDAATIASRFGYASVASMNATLRQARQSPDGAQLETDVARLQARLLDRALTLPPATSFSPTSRS
ncbi:MAG: transposase [Acidimicrobiales bacterium]